MDRKETVKKISEFLGATPKYLGAPTFAYEIKTELESYTIDRQGVITTLQGRTITLDEILNAEQMKKEMKPVAEEQIEESTSSTDEFELKLPLEGHTGITLQNIVNMLSSKQHLINLSFEMTEVFMDETFAEDLHTQTISTIEDFEKAINELGLERCPGLGFDFEEGTFSYKIASKNLTPEKIAAFQDLAVKINETAKKLKHTSFKQAQDDNPKYAFRTWLIRLGMNGSEYKTTRKVLLSNLEGSGAFRKVPKEKGVQVNG